ncbi:ORF6N domain-containing protein [Ferruginibacter sp.]|nr:ORF6N domain-containing protein [Ferruginibacter sp.]
MNLQIIHNKIFEVRGQRVMLDFDLAELYQTETKYLKRAVRQNLKKFPIDFMFELTKNEFETLRCNFSTSKRGGIRYMPFAFTEHGVTMLASVLNSDKAIDMNIAIVRAFIAMRHFANNHKDLFEQINDLRKEMQARLGEHDTQLGAIYDALENLLDKKEEEATTKQQWKERERIGFKK